MADVVQGRTLHLEGVAAPTDEVGPEQAAHDHCTIPQGRRGLSVHILHKRVFLGHLVGVQGVHLLLRVMVLVKLVLQMILDWAHIEGLSHRRAKALLLAIQGSDGGELQ